MAKPDEAKRARVLRVYAETGSVSKTARIVGCDRAWARRVIAESGATTDIGATAPPTPAREFREDGDAATCAAVTDRPVKTLEDAIRVAEVDLATWYVDRWECSQWTVPLKVTHEDGKRKVAVQTQQYRVKLTLKRLMPRSHQTATDAIFARMAKHAPDYRKAGRGGLSTRTSPAGEPHLAVFGLFDVHFGKLAWGAETGDNYDLKIAERVYSNAVDDLLAESAHRNVGRFLLPIGNDFYHMDNAQNKTLNGTPQDVDGRYAKVIEAGEMAVIAAVERLAERAPVSVVWVPGNHDPTTSYHLARTVRAWFHRHKSVEVDAGPSPRKYFAYGSTLLGLTHGNEEKHDALPNLMAAEKPAEWAASTCREWLIGHEHRSRQWTTKPVDTSTGTVVRMLRSLAGTDAWHHRKGYISAGHAAEVYWYGEARGYAGHAVAQARHE